MFICICLYFILVFFRFKLYKILINLVNVNHLIFCVKKNSKNQKIKQIHKIVSIFLFIQ